MTGATFGISEAVWAAGDFRKKVVEAPPRERALVTVRVRTENVAGVKLPVFTLVRDSAGDAELDVLGIAGGGRQIGAARDKFATLLEGLVRLGSLQTSFLTLDAAIKLTNRVRCEADHLAPQHRPGLPVESSRRTPSLVAFCSASML